MVLNSSSLLNASHPQVQSGFCISSMEGTFIFTAFNIVNMVLIVPLCVLVLYVGFQQRAQLHSSSAITSDVDHFTYHMAAMEIIGVIGSFFYNTGIYVRNTDMQEFGFYVFSIIIPGQALFHCLTSVERYMAVVHPVTYMGLRKTSGIRIRYVSIGCVWLLGVGWICIMYLHFPHFPSVLFLLLYIFSLSIICFCGVSVLCALARSGPGGGARDRVDQSKQRAFYMVVGIMAALFLRFFGLLICTVMYNLVVSHGVDGCSVLKGSLWLGLPSSLVLPLLFLHKTGRLDCFRCSSAEDDQQGETK